MTEYETQRLYLAFVKIGLPTGYDPSTTLKKVVVLSDCYDYFRVEGSLFLDQVFTAPIKMQRDYKAYAENEAVKKVHSPDPCLDFGAFCMAIWLLTHYELATLSFKMTDKDGSGALDKGEVESIVNQVYSNSSARAGREICVTVNRVEDRAKKILEGMDVDGDGQVTLPEYCVMVKSYHYLLSPAFDVQHRVRSKIFGNWGIDWGDIERNRKEKAANTDLIDIVKHVYTQINGEMKKRNAFVNDRGMDAILSADATTSWDAKEAKINGQNSAFAEKHRASLKNG